MNSFTNASMPLKLFGVVLALALVAVAALLVTPTSAQSPDNTYDDPQPCGFGQGASTAFQAEPHEKTTGHYALFDAYWEDTGPDQAQTPGLDPDQTPDNTGILHTNECPPLLTTETQDLQTVTTLTDSGVDIDELIIHVENSRQATVVEGNPDDRSTHHLRLDQYPGVRDHANVGEKVWWLRLDDPDLSGDQKSDLTLGFSTHRFDKKYWTKVSYEFRLLRNPGIAPSEHPHLLAYRARQSGVPGATKVWDSAEAGIASMEMAPGELINDLQWVFTKPGTYEISAQPVGYVRNKNPHAEGDEEYDANWKAISANVTEAGEVKKYVIHVGPLVEVEPPLLGVSRSVPENSPAGTNVGDPFLVYSEASDLGYSLSGVGHENFVATATTDADPYGVQIKVAEGASLDYETKATYDLTLGVTNKIDHESNPDPTVDDTLVVRISLDDVAPTVSLAVDNASPAVGDTVTFRAVFQHFEEVGEYLYDFDSLSNSDTLTGRVTTNNAIVYTTTRNSALTETFTFSATYDVDDDGSNRRVIHAENVTVTWGNP